MPSHRIKFIVFDLEGTLFRSPGLNERFLQLAMQLLEEKKCVSAETARQLFENGKNKLRTQTGYDPPLTGVLINLGIKLGEWAAFNTKRLNPEEFIRSDLALGQLLSGLSRTYHISVMTNLNEAQSRRILSALGVDNYISRVFSPTAESQVKPSVTHLRQILRILRARPGECLMVGDRFHIDLRPATSLGMRIFLVGGPEDLLGEAFREVLK